MGKTILILLSIWLFVAAIPNGPKPVPKAAYRVETIPMPEGLSAETGAIDFLPDGRLVASFHRGEVMFYNPKTKQWSLFAEGLHEPLGILVVSNSELIIMQRPELTRVKDRDGDGRADLYEKVTDAFGISGNYHEFNYGPIRDKAGNLYIGLNTASPNGGVRSEVRGTRDTVATDHPKQMFSPVPYRGWIMKLNASDHQLVPYASGFRSPNGLVFDPNGRMLVTDNQGDWVGTSPLYAVEEGKFYGHPASLVWNANWRGGNPLAMTLPELEAMRTKAAVLFPHGILANSITQPVLDNTGGKFGPFAGQLLIGEMNQERIVRVMLEEVAGQLQGACIPFLDGQGLRKGNNRLAFAPDGSLWTGQNDHGWAGAKGIQRIVYTGKPPMDVYTMNLTPNGFDLTFTQPVDAATASRPENYQFRHYRYEYHKTYGSPQFDIAAVPVKAVTVSKDRRKVSLNLADLKPGLIYELTLGDVRATNGEPLANRLICYTLNHLKP
ncbi:PQQ-dependent sugar dehydrogenase [Larkinella insperata]|uniref:PQQ-dependent sugar dehydrogenase n=1 Tax=Larkinella insperata TaxID=332158 RepID=A0ABW3Q4R7_9BACT|nr:PQQ-dependent sugar dehydrogenase [Larkinella insperata]